MLGPIDFTVRAAATQKRSCQSCLTKSLDVIRNYQAKTLYDNYKLTSLYIYRNGISKSFENQVLARYFASFKFIQ